MVRAGPPKGGRYEVIDLVRVLLLSDPEVFGEAPRLIHPLRLAVEAGVVCEADEFVVRILVGAFGPDCFVLFELNG